MLKRVVFGNIFNQVYSIDAGSSHVVLATRTGQTIVREPCLISLAARKPPLLRRGRRSTPPPPPQYRLHAVGTEALPGEGSEDNGIRLVHPIAHGHIEDLEALELVLRKVIGRAPMNPVRKMLLGTRMTLVAPLHLEELERLRYQDILRDFGFGRISAVDAPLAAARGAGVDVGASRGQMLIDVGGGQSTVATFSLGSIAAWHWSPTGGGGLDAAIAAHVQRRYRVQLRPAMAEWIKLTLGSVYPRARPETLDFRGFDAETGVEKKVTLDDNELRDVLIDACEPLVMTVHQSFEAVPPELAADVAQGEITLVGGGALLAGLPEFLGERTGLRFRVADDPINAAIRGAFEPAPADGP